MRLASLDSKSTFFNVLTKSQAAAENFPFCTIDPNENKYTPCAGGTDVETEPFVVDTSSSGARQQIRLPG